MPNESSNSPHILNTSATLMGFCFVVLTSVRINSRAVESIIDEITAVAIVLFMASCLLSFLSIRSVTKRGLYYEKMAEYGFLVGLFILFLMTVLLALNIVK